MCFLKQVPNIQESVEKPQTQEDALSESTMRGNPWRGTTTRSTRVSEPDITEPFDATDPKHKHERREGHENQRNQVAETTTVSGCPRKQFMSSQGDEFRAEVFIGSAKTRPRTRKTCQQSSSILCHRQATRG